jgi:hypothetical protein
MTQRAFLGILFLSEQCGRNARIRRNDDPIYSWYTAKRGCCVQPRAESSLHCVSVSRILVPRNSGSHNSGSERSSDSVIYNLLAALLYIVVPGALYTTLRPRFGVVVALGGTVFAFLTILFATRLLEQRIRNRNSSTYEHFTSAASIRAFAESAGAGDQAEGGEMREHMSVENAGKGRCGGNLD